MLISARKGIWHPSTSDIDCSVELSKKRLPEGRSPTVSDGIRWCCKTWDKWRRVNGVLFVWIRTRWSLSYDTYIHTLYYIQWGSTETPTNPMLNERQLNTFTWSSLYIVDYSISCKATPQRGNPSCLTGRTQFARTPRTLTRVTPSASKFLIPLLPWRSNYLQLPRIFKLIVRPYVLYFFPSRDRNSTEPLDISRENTMLCTWRNSIIRTRVDASSTCWILSSKERKEGARNNELEFAKRIKINKWFFAHSNAGRTFYFITVTW